MTISVSLELDDASIERLKDDLEEEARQTVVTVSTGIGATARTDHPWQNRSGNLQANTHGSVVVWGDFWNETLSGEVLGETEYGSYLEADGESKWSWLYPAAKATDSDDGETLDRALQRGADRAGWGE